MDTIANLDHLFDTDEAWYENTWVEQDASVFINGIAFSTLVIYGNLAHDDAVEALISEFTDALLDIVAVADSEAKFLEILMDLVMTLVLVWYNTLSDEERKWVAAQVEEKALGILEVELEKKLWEKIEKKLQQKLVSLLRKEILRYAGSALRMARALPAGKVAAKFMIETVVRGGKAQFQKRVVGVVGGAAVPLYYVAKAIAEPLAEMTKSIKGAQDLEWKYPQVWKQMEIVCRKSPEAAKRLKALNQAKYLYFLVEDHLRKIVGFAEDHYEHRAKAFSLST